MKHFILHAHHRFHPLPTSNTGYERTISWCDLPRGRPWRRLYHLSRRDEALATIKRPRGSTTWRWWSRSHHKPRRWIQVLHICAFVHKWQFVFFSFQMRRIRQGTEATTFHRTSRTWCCLLGWYLLAPVFVASKSISWYLSLMLRLTWLAMTKEWPDIVFEVSNLLGKLRVNLNVGHTACLSCPIGFNPQFPLHPCVPLRP